MTYNKRKAQLNAAMTAALRKTGHGFYFPEDTINRPAFYPVYAGGTRKEYLYEVYIDDAGLIEVVTRYESDIYPGTEEEVYSGFAEFSNDEMEEIMKLCGVPVPGESRMVTEHLALGLLNTDKPLVYGVINTA